MNPGLHVVTGAFGFSGRLIAERLLAAGKRVRTLTGHPRTADPLAEKIEIAPFNFAHLPALIESLQGAEVLYNTYWIRFPHGGSTFEQAVRNSRQLFTAAKEAGVQRVVHVSIANPSLRSPLPYYRGKAQVEQSLADTGLSRALLRPTVLFGDQGILINNMAWIIRRFPVFPLPGEGDYRLQPIAASDLADLAVAAGERRENEIIEAGGPETFTFVELLAVLARLVGSPVWFPHVPPAATLWLTRMLGLLVGDVVLTRDELRGLMDNLLVAPGPPAGTKRLSEWLAEHRDEVGRRYFSEVARHYSGRKA